MTPMFLFSKASHNFVGRSREKRLLLWHTADKVCTMLFTLLKMRRERPNMGSNTEWDGPVC